MVIRFSILVCLGLLTTALGCAGMSGQRFYEESSATGRGLDDVVDCPTCPSAGGQRDAIVHAAPGDGHDDGVIPPHAKFHPLPTRPVFAPKVSLAAATVEAVPQTSSPTPTPALADSNGDEAPAPPAATIAEARPSSRSVLKRSEPKLLTEDTMASVLVARKAPRLAAIKHTSAEPTPAAASVPVVATPPATASSPRNTGDGWRPRVAN